MKESTTDVLTVSMMAARCAIERQVKKLNAIISKKEEAFILGNMDAMFDNIDKEWILYDAIADMCNALGYNLVAEEYRIEGAHTSFYTYSIE